MIRILQVVNSMERAGLETMLMNYYRNIDRTQVQFDFLTHRSYRGVYDEEIEAMGGKVYYAPRLYPQNYIKYFKFMKNFFKEHPEYKIVHSHIDTMSAFPLYAAKISNIPIRIAHSHTSKLDKDAKLFIKYLAKLVVPYVSNVYYSCGKVAGEFLYGKKEFHIINNAINLSKFKYDSRIREKVREELQIKNDFVIGHVGRYCYIKNQMFLLEILKEVLKTLPNAKLLLIGTGEDEEKLRKKANELGIKESVYFLINRSDVERLYQVMDVFVMPSFFEGVPLVGIEAQANGVPCIFSDKISKEILLTDNAQMQNIENGVEFWANKIINIDVKRDEENIDKLSKEGYDISFEANKLMQQYLNLYTK
ncbi:TPA: glycosyltransferase family 1 protein [Clostridium perfringens]|nr:glycosyltransferase family 1 protein [Clostridium perfringens]HAT4091522.1 glycosyltransferase family 1 protein [Clostridium perfringens]